MVPVSVPSRVRKLRKMRNFWANFTDFEPEINIMKCKTEKLEYFNARLSQVAEIGGLPAARVRPPPISLAARSRIPTAGRLPFAHRHSIGATSVFRQ